MRAYKIYSKSGGRWRKIALVSAVILLILGIGALVAVRRLYNENLRPVNTSSRQEIVVAIPSGSSLDQIAAALKKKQVIKADWAFKRYVNSHQLAVSLKAGTYRFNTSQDVATIVKALVDGKVDVGLFTIFPTQRLDEIRLSLIENGKFTAGQVDDALDPAKYAGHPALVDKPAGASLEGYLYPESYQKVAETTPQVIVAAALDQMAKALTPDIRAGIAKQGLSVHQGIIVASIVEQEIPAEPLAPAADRRQAAQVFLKRLSTGMQLGSDVTAFYGAEIASKPKSVEYDSPYNTRLYVGLPPGPIGNVTKDGLNAVAFPATTDYLYFVAGDDHVTYFSKTLAEHQALTAEHCKQGCGN